MFKVEIRHLSDGLTTISRVVTPVDAGVEELPEFDDNIDLEIKLEKIGGNIFTKIDVACKAKLYCDRCAENFHQKLKESGNFLYSFDENLSENAQDDVIPLSKQATEIDLTNLLRELLILSIPIKRLCDKDCKGLCPDCGQNLNQASCECKTNNIDPRWEKLRQLQKEN